jgi:hypothetical protein
LASWFCVGQPDHTEAIQHGGNAGGQIDQFRGNRLANI